MSSMENLKFTSDYYGKFQYQYSIDNLPLLEGFVNYHKLNFSKYFDLPEDAFSGLKVLDTGCGPGKHAVILSLMGADVTAVDLSPENIQQGEKIKKFYKLNNLRFVQYDLMEPFKDAGQFDLVSAHNWMQHAENPSVVLKNLISVLKTKGRIYLSLYHAGTFRFFTSQIARSVLKRHHFDLMKDLVKYHFPAGFKEFNNPDDIYMEVIFDDYFVPYCNTTTYDVVIDDAKKLGCTPITPKPVLGEIYGLDNIPLRIGFEKKEKVHDSGGLRFSRQVDEFSNASQLFMIKSIDLAKKIITYLTELNDPFITCSFCLGLFYVRAVNSRITDAEKKHKMLQSYLEMCLSKSTKHISAFYDAQKIYSK